LDELGGIEKTVRDQLFRKSRSTSDNASLAHVELSLLTYYTFAHHLFKCARLTLEFGFPVIAGQLSRGLFEIRIDIAYLLAGNWDDILKKGDRYIEHSQAYLQHFAKKVEPSHNSNELPNYEEFEKLLMDFKRTWNVQTNRELEHWSGLSVEERCTKSNQKDSYVQFRWMSQNTHLSPVILEKFIRHNENRFEYLDGQMPIEVSSHANELMLHYLIICSQIVEWFGLYKEQVLFTPFFNKIEKRVTR
jgi:hypothetical protein